MKRTRWLLTTITFCALAIVATVFWRKVPELFARGRVRAAAAEGRTGDALAAYAEVLRWREGGEDPGLLAEIARGVVRQGILDRDLFAFRLACELADPSFEPLLRQAAVDEPAEAQIAVAVYGWLARQGDPEALARLRGVVGEGLWAGPAAEELSRAGDAAGLRWARHHLRDEPRRAYLQEALAVLVREGELADLSLLIGLCRNETHIVRRLSILEELARLARRLGAQEQARVLLGDVLSPGSAEDHCAHAWLGDSERLEPLLSELSLVDRASRRASSARVRVGAGSAPELRFFRAKALDATGDPRGLLEVEKVLLGWESPLALAAGRYLLEDGRPERVKLVGERARQRLMPEPNLGSRGRQAADANACLWLDLYGECAERSDLSELRRFLERENTRLHAAGALLRILSRGAGS